MARRSRRRNREGEDLAEMVGILLQLPWYVSVILAIVAYIFLAWALPPMVTNKFLAFVPMLSIAAAPWIAGGLLLVGAISYFKNRAPGTESQTSSGIMGSGYEPNNGPNTDFGLFTTRMNPQSVHSEWSLQLLTSLEWKRFEMLCAEYFAILGKQVETTEKGADGGIDVRVYENGRLEYAIQCKSWSSLVGVAPVRELYGVMDHESAGKGVFITTSAFSKDAIAFAEQHKEKLFLIDGEKFTRMLIALPQGKKDILLKMATEGDYTTPSCASCGVKMVKRSGKTGDFWGCVNYPRCRSKLRCA